MVFAVREPSDDLELAGLRELVVRGLGDGDARALLASAIPGRLDERVRDRIVAETRGNPLALLELPRGLTAAEVAGGFERPDARPLASQIEQSFLRRIGRFRLRRNGCCSRRRPSRWATCLVEAGGGAARDRGGRGGGGRGGGVDRARYPGAFPSSARALGGLSRGGPGDRQEVHRALAEATDPDTDPDRRAWHRAHAAVEPDEAVAGELVRSADRAQGRGGVAAAAAFLRASDRADARSGPTRRAGAGRRAGQVRGRRLRTRRTSCSRPRSWARWTSSSARGWHGFAPRSCSPAGAGATRRNCCSMRPNGSNRSTADWRVRRIWKRSEPRSSPAASTAATGCGRRPRPPGPRRGDRNRLG